MPCTNVVVAEDEVGEDLSEFCGDFCVWVVSGRRSWKEVTRD